MNANSVINYFPLWKYLMVLFVLVIGLIYSIPSFYGEDYAVYIMKHVTNNPMFDSLLENNVKQLLADEKIISKSVFFYQDKLLVRFYCKQDQLLAYEKLSRSVLSKKYFFVLGKIAAMPYWFFFIKAKPIRLGLDLSGGVRLVVRSDIESTLSKHQEQYMELLRSTLSERAIPYVQLYITKSSIISIDFNCFESREQAILCFSKMYQHDLLFNVEGDTLLHIGFSKNYINKICSYVIQQNTVILRNRMCQLGIIDPLVQIFGTDRILIELPGIQDITDIKSIFGTSANLEFRLVNSKIDNFAINNNLIPEDSEIKIDKNGYLVPLYKRVVLKGDYIINSDINFDEYNRPQINITLDNIGSSIMNSVSKDNIGKLMATVFVEYKDSGEKDANGCVIFNKHETIINIATIQSQLTNKFCIIGISNLNEARNLSVLLRMGSLAAPVHIEEERIIGPMLGKQNIRQGSIACGLGILISVFFMVFWYRSFGLIASAALIVNLVLMVGMISLIPGVMLTMPSIAGIVLTLSVAIDSNVLINERIKEEIKQGKPMQYAIYIGYRKAFISIVDSNVTTIITSFILCCISIESIKSFAIITIIGVGTSMFTSIIGTRAIVNLIYGKKRMGKLSI